MTEELIDKSTSTGFRLPPYTPPPYPRVQKPTRRVSDARRPFVETLWYHESKAVVKTIQEADGRTVNIREHHWGRQATCAKCKRERRNPGEFKCDEFTGKGAAILLVGVMTLFFMVISGLIVWHP